MIVSLVLLKMSEHGRNLLAFCILGALALVGLVMLFNELRNAARARRLRIEAFGVPAETIRTSQNRIEMEVR